MNRIGVSNLRRLAAFAPEICLGLLIALLAMPPVAAQSTGSIVGRVTDVSGAIVVDAKIVVTSVETGLKRTTATTSEGYFSAPSLPPANYTVSAELPGFKKAVSETMKVDTTAVARVDLKLAPQDSKVEVEVSEEPIRCAAGGRAG